MTATPPSRIHDLIPPHVAARGDSPAYKDYDGTVFSWRDFDSLVAEMQTRLMEGGAGAGERVMVVAENCIAVPAALMACSRIGAWAVPVNARMSESEIARIAGHAGPCTILYTSHMSGEAEAHAKGAGAKSVQCGFGQIHIAKGAPDPEIESGDDPTAILLYTTGTTGDPKGVMLTHANLLFAGRASAQMRGLVADDHVCGVLPLTHVFGIASMLIASAMVGAMVQLARRFDPETLLPELKNNITAFPAVPQMHAMLMSCAGSKSMEKLRPRVLRYVSSGAAPLDPAWKRKAEAFYDLPLQNGYGMTETAAGIAATTTEEMGDPDTSVGLPVPGGVRVRLDHTIGEDDAVGEILVHGKNVMKGYFRNSAATAAAFTDDGWLRTGDLGRMDGAGRLHVVGRSKELIIRGGFNVYPVEVETVLNDHPAVLQSAVIGRVVDGDEEVLAFVQLHGNDNENENENENESGAVGAEDLRAYAATKLAGYKCPRHVLIVDTLPAAATGKILKHQLATHFAKQLAALEK